MTQPPPYAQGPTFSPQVHTDPNPVQATGLDQNTINTMRGKLVESILQIVVQAITGIFLPGPLGSAFTQLSTWAFTSLPAQIITAIENAIKAILNGLLGIALPTGSGSGSLNSVVETAMKDLKTEVTTVTNAVDGLWSKVQTMGGLILQVIQGLEQTPILKPFDLLGGIWFWVGGLWNSVVQSLSKANPAVSTHENRIAALEKSTAVLGAPVKFDDFNDPTLANWTVIGGHAMLFVGNGYVHHGNGFRCGEFTASSPATGKYNWQADVTAFGYGWSRLVFEADSGFTSMVAVDLHRDAANMTIQLGHATAIDGALAADWNDHMIATGGFKDGDVIAGQVDETTAGGPTYMVLYNTKVICTYQDLPDVNGHGVGHRHNALATNLDNNPTFPGCGWDAASLADIP